MMMLSILHAKMVTSVRLNGYSKFQKIWCKLYHNLSKTDNNT